MLKSSSRFDCIGVGVNKPLSITIEKSLNQHMPRENTSDYLKIFLEDTPLLDVRAGVEFSKGAYPQSVNVPILDDDQRCAVGTCYKQNGQDAAIALGHELITPELKEQRCRIII